MKSEKIREMSVEGIGNEIGDLQKEVMKLRLGNRTGTVDNPLEIRRKKRTIARMKTILTEKTAAGK
jgi:large subunit ribosomal protein L29